MPHHYHFLPTALGLPLQLPCPGFVLKRKLKKKISCLPSKWKWQVDVLGHLDSPHPVGSDNTARVYSHIFSRPPRIRFHRPPSGFSSLKNHPFSYKFIWAALVFGLAGSPLANYEHSAWFQAASCHGGSFSQPNARFPFDNQHFINSLC